MDEFRMKMLTNQPDEPSMQENMDGFPISINDIAIGFSGGEVSMDLDVSFEY